MHAHPVPVYVCQHEAARRVAAGGARRGLSCNRPKRDRPRPATFAAEFELPCFSVISASGGVRRGD